MTTQPMREALLSVLRATHYDGMALESLDSIAEHLLGTMTAHHAGLASEVERLRALLNTPEVSDFAKGVVLEAAHQREKWDDETKRDFDWAAVAHWLLAKALINPPQNDGTVGEKARLHRLVALGALVANWHAAVLARDGAEEEAAASVSRSGLGAVTCSKCRGETFIGEPHECVS
jgi:hypothetical protein